MIERQAPWPAALRVELREGHQKGRLLYASPDTQNSQVSIIVRQPDGYRLANDANHLASGSLLETVLRTFDEQQKTKLGNRNLQARQLRQQLLVAAVQDRQRTAEILGLPVSVPICGRPGALPMEGLDTHSAVAAKAAGRPFAKAFIRSSRH